MDFEIPNSKSHAKVPVRTDVALANNKSENNLQNWEKNQNFPQEAVSDAKIEVKI